MNISYKMGKKKSRERQILFLQNFIVLFGFKNICDYNYFIDYKKLLKFDTLVENVNNMLSELIYFISI